MHFKVEHDPSLLSINYHAPYLHRGQAQTVEEIFPLHGLGPDGQDFPPKTTIQTQLTAAQRADLLTFLKSIDGTTPISASVNRSLRSLVGYRSLSQICRAPCY